MAGENQSSVTQDGLHVGRQAELDQLVARATSKYSVKDYDAAAELYSHATELQAAMNGEMAARNADLLYAYGRCLYHAAVRNSDVLGAKVAGEKQQVKPEVTRKQNGIKVEHSDDDGTTKGDFKVPRDDFTSMGDQIAEGSTDSVGVQGHGGKPYFQFTGDENFDESDDEVVDQPLDGAPCEGAEEEEEDDFANAFEVLDLARVLLIKRLYEEEGREQDKTLAAADQTKTINQLKERLADTHDLQAEISLEGERFANAVEDLRAALELKKGLFPQESSLIAEAHYKLSLALEFASVPQPKPGENDGDHKADAQNDNSMRAQSADEMEAAIASCKLRISSEEEALRARKSEITSRTEVAVGAETRITQREIDDVKEMVADMEQRLVELRQSPVSINDFSSAANHEGSLSLGGILGSVLGKSEAAQQEKLSEASKGAKDLSDLVKRRKQAAHTAAETTEDEAAKNGGKRKVEFVEEVVEVGTGKKAKLSDANGEQA